MVKSSGFGRRLRRRCRPTLMTVMEPSLSSLVIVQIAVGTRLGEWHRQV